MPDQVKYMDKLKGAKVLVIGGSSGIGYGVAEALVEYGAIVTVSSSNPSRVDKTVERLKKSYPSASSRISGHACNLGDEASLEANIVALLDKVGPIDHLIHTAGDSLVTKKIQDVKFDEIKQAGMVRFFSALLVAKHAPKYLSGGPRSSITLTTGSICERPRPDWTVIGSYAAGLQGMCRGLALDLKPIRVNLVAPGAVDSEMWDSHFTPDQKEGYLKTLAGTLPTGVAGKVEDVAESYLYFMRDRNVTGSMISTNGGALLL